MSRLHFYEMTNGYVYPLKNQEGATHYTHEYFVYGDYVGSSVEKANVKCLLDDKALVDRLGIAERHESYSTVLLMFPIASLNDPELNEVFEKVEEYPCLSDDELSHVEMGMQGEDWELFGRSDFRRHLRSSYPDFSDKVDDASAEDMDGLFSEIEKNSNYGIWSPESGTSGYFDFESMGGIPDKADKIIKEWLSKKG